MGPYLDYVLHLGLPVHKFLCKLFRRAFRYPWTTPDGTFCLWLCHDSCNISDLAGGYRVTDKVLWRINFLVLLTIAISYLVGTAILSAHKA